MEPGASSLGHCCTQVLPNEISEQVGPRRQPRGPQMGQSCHEITGYNRNQPDKTRPTDLATSGSSKPKSLLRRKRRLPESNWCKRLCRPGQVRGFSHSEAVQVFDANVVANPAPRLASLRPGCRSPRPRRRHQGRPSGCRQFSGTPGPCSRFCSSWERR